MDVSDSTKAPEPKSRAGAWFKTWACIVVGFLIVTWTDFGTSEFRALSAFMPFALTGVMAVFLLPVVVGASWVANLLARKGRLPSWINSTTINAFGFLVLAAQTGVAIYSSQPKNRLAAAMGGERLVEGDVRVIGFTAFLGSRWLYEFTTTPAQLETITQRLGMHEVEPYDLSANLRRDVSLGSQDSSVVQGVPGAEGVRMFREEQKDETAGRWIVLVYRVSDGRSWLYRGNQR